MKRTWMLTAVLAVVSAVVDTALRHFAHPVFWWHAIPAFDLVYGFVGCAAIVLLSKWLGHRFLMRDESYYEREP